MGAYRSLRIVKYINTAGFACEFANVYLKSSTRILLFIIYLLFTYYCYRFYDAIYLITIIFLYCNAALLILQIN